MTRAALQETLLEDGLDRFRVVVENLTDEHDLMEVALAAVKLAHEATAGGAADEEEIPEATPAPPSKPGAPRRPVRGPAGGMTRLWVGAGRTAGIRPQDLVGAIANEAGIPGRDIGAIEIADKFSLVEVPEAAADQVVQALKGSTIKGRKATVRRDRAS
jgi:ATP-dependent RNA helicase DeaD